MNGNTLERAQGVCPIGWHIPSDCEWMYLEGILGMSVYQQQRDNFRSEGNVGNKLFAGGSTGFNGLYGGYRFGSFSQRGEFTQWWSSTPYFPSGAMMRSFLLNNSASYRSASGTAAAGAVRCLKD